MCEVSVAVKTLSWLTDWAWVASTAKGAVVSIGLHSSQASGSG